jgi:hypothetical protein
VTKPVPLISGGGLDCANTSGVTIRGVVVDGKAVQTTGIQGRDSRGLTIEDTTVRNFRGNGINVEAYKLARCSNFAARGVVVEKCYPAGSAHAQGINVGETDGVTLDGVALLDNGGKPGVETVFNHNAYIHADCTNVVANAVVSLGASSHGAQFRAGGIVANCIFIDNAIGFSYGLVNSAECKTGGVTGSVSDVVCIGGKSINGSARGWAAEFSNLRDVVVSGLIVAHDNQDNSEAIHFDNCSGLTNGTVALPPSKWRIDVQAYVFDWTKKPTKVVSGAAVHFLAPVGPPPRQPNLRLTVGDMRAKARANPRTAAADAVRDAKIAAGLIASPAPEPMPEPSPPPPPTTAPAPEETLEAMIRGNPADVTAAVEGGVAVLKVNRAGTDPRFTVTGDTVTRK